jgi:hypothetical protein
MSMYNRYSVLFSSDLESNNGICRVGYYYSYSYYYILYFYKNVLQTLIFSQRVMA